MLGAVINDELAKRGNFEKIGLSVETCANSFEMPTFVRCLFLHGRSDWQSERCYEMLGEHKTQINH